MGFSQISSVHVGCRTCGHGELTLFNFHFCAPPIYELLEDRAFLWFVLVSGTQPGSIPISRAQGQGGVEMWVEGKQVQKEGVRAPLD